MRKLPGWRTPSMIWTLIVPPGGMGVPSATETPDDEGPAAGPGPTALTASEELKPPPATVVCVGGSSSVVCCTVQLFEGQAAFEPVIETVAGVVPEVMTRRSAVPSGALKVERSMTRKRLGGRGEVAAGSSRESVTASLRWTGEWEFSGPGAPRRAPAPMSVPVVSTKKKSAALSFVSFGEPSAGQGPAVGA